MFPRIETLIPQRNARPRESRTAAKARRREVFPRSFGKLMTALRVPFEAIFVSGSETDLPAHADARLSSVDTSRILAGAFVSRSAERRA